MTDWCGLVDDPDEEMKLECQGCGKLVYGWDIIQLDYPDSSNLCPDCYWQWVAEHLEHYPEEEVT